MIHITFGRTVSAIGRNGHIKQIGVEVLAQEHSKVVCLSPLHSRGVANGSLDIPFEQLGLFIEALQSIKEEAYKKSA